MLVSLIAVVGADAAVNQVTINSGQLKGRVTGKIVSFKGISFRSASCWAKSLARTAGRASWTGVREAAEYGSDCMQLPFPGDAAPLGVTPREDCLYMNILGSRGTSRGEIDSAALKALRALPAERLVNGLNMATMNTPTYAGPMLDRQIVVEPPDEVFRAGRQAKMPLIAGANSQDIGFSSAKTSGEIYAPFGVNRAKAESAWNPEGNTDARQLPRPLQRTG